jgi:hypothetical protein
MFSGVWKFGEISFGIDPGQEIYRGQLETFMKSLEGNIGLETGCAKKMA